MDMLFLSLLIGPGPMTMLLLFLRLAPCLDGSRRYRVPGAVSDVILTVFASRVSRDDHRRPRPEGLDCAGREAKSSSNEGEWSVPRGLDQKVASISRS